MSFKGLLSATAALALMAVAGPATAADNLEKLGKFQTTGRYGVSIH